MSEKIYITKNFCPCRLCKGSQRVETILDREAFLAFMSGTHKQILADGRQPDLLTYPADCTAVWWSAAGNPEVDINRLGKEIFRIPASVHGCFKIVRNQEVSVHAPVMNWDVDYEIVYTRKSEKENV